MQPVKKSSSSLGKKVAAGKDARSIYLAKCKDLGIPPTKPREARFMEIFERNCSGNVFDMRDQGLGPNTAGAIADYLSHDERYTSLLLSGNLIQGQGATAFANLLLVNTTITYMDLRSNDIDTTGGLAIFKALESNQTLTILDVSGMRGINRNHLGAKCAEAISRALQVNRVLNRLYLSENGLSSDGVAKIAAGIAGVHNPHPALSVLEVGHNSLGWEGCSRLCRGLAASKVEELLIPGNHIGDSGASSLAELLSTKPHPILTLDVSSNNITAKGVRHLGEALKNGSALAALTLSNNTLGHAGARLLAAALAQTDYLTTLVLAQSQIDAAGCAELAEALRRNSSLTKLDLYGNRIGDDGAAALAEALEFDRKLIYLDVSMNRIGNQGGIDIAALVYRNEVLRHLDIHNNELQDPAAEQLARSLQENRTLLHLGVDMNDFNYKFFSQIEQRIAENQRRYKSESILRYQQEINALRLDEDRLFSLRMELHHTTLEQQDKEQEAKEIVKDLEDVEEKYRGEMNTYQDTIQESTKAIGRYENKQVAVLKEISRFKAEKEMKVRNLVAKIHKERDTNMRLEKKVAMRGAELRDLQQSSKSEIDKLNEQLRRELFDRKQAELDHQNSVDRLRTVVERIRNEMYSAERVSSPERDGRPHSKAAT